MYKTDIHPISGMHLWRKLGPYRICNLSLIFCIQYYYTFCFVYRFFIFLVNPPPPPPEDAITYFRPQAWRRMHLLVMDNTNELHYQQEEDKEDKNGHSYPEWKWE